MQNINISKSFSGKENECPRGKDFDLNDHMAMITDDVQGGTCPADEGMQTINTTKLSNVINSLTPDSSCSSTPTVSRDTAPRDVSIYTHQARKRRMLGDLTFDDDEWSTTQYFQSNWLTQIGKHQKDILPVAEIRENKNWFTLLPNKQDPKKSR